MKHLAFYSRSFAFIRGSFDSEKTPGVHRDTRRISADESFDSDRRYHGLWKMYGLELPDAVLKKLYYENAERLIPNIGLFFFTAPPAFR